MEGKTEIGGYEFTLGCEYFRSVIRFPFITVNLVALNWGLGIEGKIWNRDDGF